MKTPLFLKTALVTGLLAISGTSFAAATTVTTTFTGTIANSCSMATGTVGTLGLSADGKSMSSSYVNGGTRGTFTLTCTGTASMTVAAPVPAAGTIALTNSASLTTKWSNLYAATAPLIEIANAGGTTASSQPSGIYEIIMTFTSASVLAPGSYAASVVTTVTPN